MISLYEGGVYLVRGTELIPEKEKDRVKLLTGQEADKEAARKETIAYSILQSHNTSGQSVRHGAVSHSLCAYQLPQHLVCGGRHHQ